MVFDVNSPWGRFRYRAELSRRQSCRETPMWVLLCFSAAFVCALLNGAVIVGRSVTFAGDSHDLPRLPSSVSVVVPTYNEAENLRMLCEHVVRACKAAKVEVEILIVDDDSGDGIDRVIRLLREDGYPVRLHVRRGERGLSSAVLAGFALAKAEVVVVMDADLSHPPERIPALADPVLKGRADLALGSRYADGGVIKDWPLARRIISWGATVLARPLVSVSDPMSGFFAVRKATWQRHASLLNPTGFKIALEFLVKCGIHRVVEVPITFKDRVHGESKLKFKTQLQYVWQLVHLYWFEFPLVVLAIAFAAVAVGATVLQSVLGGACCRRRQHGPYAAADGSHGDGAVRDLSV